MQDFHHGLIGGNQRGAGLFPGVGGFDVRAGLMRKARGELGGGAQAQGGFGQLVHRSGLHQQEMFAVAAELANHGQVARNHGRSGGHALEDLERAAALDHVAVAQPQRGQHGVGTVQMFEKLGLGHGREHLEVTADAELGSQIEQRADPAPTARSDDGESGGGLLAELGQRADGEVHSLPGSERAEVQQTEAVVRARRRAKREDAQVDAVGDEGDLLGRHAAPGSQVLRGDTAGGHDEAGRVEAGLLLGEELEVEHAIVGGARVVVLQFDGGQAVHLEDQERRGREPEKRQPLEDGAELNCLEAAGLEPALESAAEAEHAVDEARTNGGQRGVEYAGPALDRWDRVRAGRGGHQIEAAKRLGEQAGEGLDMGGGALRGGHHIEGKVGDPRIRLHHGCR